MTTDERAGLRDENLRGTTRLYRIRKASGLSQEELARRAGVPVRNIRSYEQQTRSINNAGALTLKQIADALGVLVEDLLEE